MTEEQKEFYNRWCAIYPSLEQVINGEARLTEPLDEIAGSTRPMDFMVDTYRLMLADLENQPRLYVVGDLPNYTDKDEMKVAVKYGTSGGVATTGGMIAVSAIIPPAAPIILAAAGIAGAAGAVAGGTIKLADRRVKRQIEKTKKKRRSQLKPLYKIASRIQHDIDMTFLWDHFNERPEQFGRIYGKLGDDERDEVRSHLYFLQESGGVSMNRLELDDFLRSL